MTIIHIDNTKQIPTLKSPGQGYKAVQSKSDEKAMAELDAIARRDHVTLEDVYCWGTYYYAVVKAEK